MTRLLTLAFLVLCLCGCESTRFYWQALQGQWQLLSAREPIEVAMERKDTDPVTRNNLAATPDLLRFAEEDLLLPVGNAYREFADIGRPYVVWNLVATPRFDLTAREWCFPIAGCSRYKGFFDKPMALAEKARLEAAGYDVDMRGVIAYSTLGWFDDPVVSTFSRLPEPAYQELILHELAHRKLYLPGDTRFNESWATAVARQGMALRQPQVQARKSVQRARQDEEEKRFLARLSKCLEELEDLYAEVEALGLSPTADSPEHEARKHAILMRFRESHLQATGSLGYRSLWIKEPLNNARLVALQDYHRWVPAFTRKLQLLHDDLPAFYQWSESLTMLPEKEREQQLNSLLEQAKADPE